MVSFVQNFSGSQIYNWLMKFSVAVEKKEYPRIDYSIWREIKRLRTYPKVSVIYREDIQNKKFKITFSVDSTDIKMIELTEENSFG